MGRPAPDVVRALPRDVDRFIPLWIESRTSVGQSFDAAERAAREGRVIAALERDDVRCYVAKIGGELAGFVVATRSSLSGMVDDGSVWIEQLYVRPGRRGHGVSKALLGQVARYAEYAGATRVISCAPAADKDANRYFARVGFGGGANLRSMPAAALARRVAEGQPEAHLTASVLRRRRTLRARADSRA